MSGNAHCWKCGQPVTRRRKHPWSGTMLSLDCLGTALVIVKRKGVVPRPIYREHECPGRPCETAVGSCQPLPKGGR